MSLFTKDSNEHIYDRYTYWLVLALIVVLPLVVCITANVSATITKAVAGGVLILLALATFAVGVIRAQVLTVPRSLLLAAAWLVPLAYGFSTLFANTRVSAYGDRLSMDSFAFILVGVALMSLVSLVFNTQKRTLAAYLALVGAAAAVSVLEFLVLFGREWLAGTGAILSSLSLLGTLNDLAVFYGLIVIFTLLSMLLLPITAIVRGILSIVLIVSLYFLSVVNLTILWWIVGLFALAMFVYGVSAGLLGDRSARTDISFAALTVVVVCAFFIFGPMALTGQPAAWAEVGELEVRPSWQSTIGIGRTVLAEQGFFGAGPGSFSRLWAAQMPPEIANTEFWQTDFTYGIGFIPTSVITTGLLGAVAWIAFLALFLWQGMRSLVLVRGARKDDIAHYVRMTSFLAALYLWIVVFIQVPSPALLLYAFLFTGIFIASLSYGGDALPPYRLVFRDNAQVGFLIALCATVTVLMSMGGMYGFASRFLAERSYQEGTRILAVSGDIDAGERAFNHALNLHPTDRYYRVLSNLDNARLQRLLQEGKSPEALREEVQTLLSRAVGNAQKATEMNGEDYQNWLNLGTIYQNIIPIGIEGSADSAIAAFTRVLDLRPSTPEALLAMATIERARGNVEQARSYVEQAITLRNRYTDAIFFLAQMQLDQNDTESAIRSVQAITLIEPQNPVGFFQLGLLYYGSNNFIQAVQSFEQAVSMVPEYANARYFLGLSHWRLGDAPRALSEFEQVMVTNPDNVEVRSIISNLRAGKAPFEPPTSAASDIQDLEGLPLEEVQPVAVDGSVSGEVTP